MKKGKTALYTGFLLVFVFVLISTSCGGCSGGNPGIKNEFDFDNKVWVDPSAQATQLTGGETLLPYSGGSKKLPGTPYSYDTWEWSEGKKVSNSKFIWYGANQGGGGAFRAEWNDYLHARLGFYWGHGGEYTKYKNMYVDYNYNRSDNVSTPTGFIGVYGWFLSPSASISSEKVIEYYITDDWFWDRQLDYMQIVGGAETVKELGSFTVDGAVYKIYQSTRVYEPSVFGQTTFTQIFSVRQGRRTYGTISVTEHFNAWRKYLKLDSIYEVTFFVEAAFDDIGNGYLDLTYLYLSQETNRRNIPAGTTPVDYDDGGEPVVGLYGAYNNNPNMGLSSSVNYQIVNLPNDANRTNVFKVTNPAEWAVALYDLSAYKNKRITINFTAQIKRVGAAGTLNWTINNSDYPSASRIENATAGIWHSMSGTWTGTPATEYPAFVLDTYENNSANTIYYIDNFNITITE